MDKFYDMLYLWLHDLYFTGCLKLLLNVLWYVDQQFDRIIEAT